MNEELESKMNKISPEKLDLVSGGAGQNYDPESGEQDIQECLKTLQEDLTCIPLPHSKKEKGKLFR